MTASRIPRIVVRGGLSLVLLLAVACIAYAALIHTWVSRWGATEDEARRGLPGDHLVPAPVYSSTRAITIRTPSEAVWPWLAQMGQGRGGFYTYDWLENLFGLRIHSVNRVIPEFQALQVGDFIRAAPADWMGGKLADKAGWRVAEVQHGRALVLEGWGAFVVEPLGSDRSRLILRGRSAKPFDAVMEPVYFIMERKMMLGIKERAERLAGIPLTRGHDEVLWFAFLAVAATLILALLVSRRSLPIRLGLTSAGTPLFVLVLFRGYPSPVYAGMLMVALAATFWWSHPRRSAALPTSVERAGG